MMQIIIIIITNYIQIILLLCNYYTNYSAIALELRDRVVGSGPAQQAMLSEGSDPANPPKQTFELNLFLKKI